MRRTVVGVAVVGCLPVFVGWAGPADRLAVAETSDPSPGAAPDASGVLSTGTRLTWYAAAASVAQSSFSITEDPSCAAGGPGCYTDPQTGRFYRKSDEGPNAQGASSASGDGFSQLDVMAVDGRNVALMSNLYVIDRTFNVLSWTPLGGATLDVGAVAGSWIEPAELERAVASGSAGMLVLTGEYQFGDRVVPSVSFVSGLGSSNYQSQTFDRQTGVLLASNGSTAGPTTQFTVDGQSAPVTGNTQLTMTRLASVRQRSVPGQDAPVPAWIAATSTLVYTGVYNWTNPIDPTSGNLDFPAQHTISMGQRGTTSAAYIARTQVPGLGLDTSTPGVGGGIGGYWWDPQALQAMSQGQTLDEDPITTEKLVVAYRGPSADGTEVVVIDSTIPGVQTRSTYDMTGLLVGYDVRLVSSGISTSIQLAQRS